MEVTDGTSPTTCPLCFRACVVCMYVGTGSSAVCLRVVGVVFISFFLRSDLVRSLSPSSRLGGWMYEGGQE